MTTDELSDQKSEPSFEQLSDEQLVAHLQKDNRNRELQSELYDRFARLVYSKCLSLTGDRELASDFTHDIFIRVFTHIHQFRGNSKFSLWLNSISYNYSIKQLTRKKIVIEDTDFDGDRLSDDESWELNFPSANPDDRIEILSRVLMSLDPEDRLLLLMKYRDDMKIYEIAEMFEMAESAVKMRLKRLRDKLKILISQIQNTM